MTQLTKRALTLGLLSLFLVNSTLAAPKAAKSVNPKLAAALQAVSPDPLGGQLGLGLATRSAASNSPAPRVTASRPSTGANAPLPVVASATAPVVSTSPRQ